MLLVINYFDGGLRKTTRPMVNTRTRPSARVCSTHHIVHNSSCDFGASPPYCVVSYTETFRKIRTKKGPPSRQRSNVTFFPSILLVRTCCISYLWACVVLGVCVCFQRAEEVHVQGDRGTAELLCYFIYSDVRLNHYLREIRLQWENKCKLLILGLLRVRIATKIETFLTVYWCLQPTTWPKLTVNLTPILTEIRSIFKIELP